MSCDREMEDEYEYKIDQSFSNFLIPKWLLIYGGQQRASRSREVSRRVPSVKRNCPHVYIDMWAASLLMLGEIDTEVILLKILVNSFVLSSFVLFCFSNILGHFLVEELLFHSIFLEIYFSFVLREYRRYGMCCRCICDVADALF